MEHISYQLAKKIKEAGFPQDGKNIEWFNRNGIFGIYYHDIDSVDTYSPLLSELIEACGNDFACLTYTGYSKMWRKFDKRNWWADCRDREGKDNTPGLGNTPEEAVANLWLKLNKK